MQIKKSLLIICFILIASFTLSGCTLEDSANSKESNQVGQQQKVYVENQPVPAFDWSLERHIFTEIYKARNNAVITYSYVRNFNGQVYFKCKSIGFPLPSNMQLTNPEALYDWNGDGEPSMSDATALPQAEPNGLYSSPSTSGTYVMCLNSDGTVSPAYFEDNIETHMSPLGDNGLETVGDSTLKIEIKQK